MKQHIFSTNIYCHRFIFNLSFNAYNLAFKKKPGINED